MKLCLIANLLKLWITVALTAGALTSDSDSTNFPVHSNEIKEDGGSLLSIPSRFHLQTVVDPRRPPLPGIPLQVIGEAEDVDEDEPSKAEVWLSNGNGNDDIDHPEVEDPESKRSMGMLRLGRAEKRARSMAALRLGRRSSSTSGLEKMRDVEDAMRVQQQQQQQQRWNSIEDKEDTKRSMGMLRLGRSDSAEEEDGNEAKRSMGMLRLGKREDDDEDDGMIRDDDDDVTMEGKRLMGMLRLGRSVYKR